MGLTGKKAGEYIKDHFTDGKWYTLEQICAGLGTNLEEERIRMGSRKQRKTGGLYYENRYNKETGKTEWLISKKSKTLDGQVLLRSIEPILQKLEAEANKGQATMIAGYIRRDVALLRKAIKEAVE